MFLHQCVRVGEHVCVFWCVCVCVIKCCIYSVGNVSCLVLFSVVVHWCEFNVPSLGGNFQQAVVVRRPHLTSWGLSLSPLSANAVHSYNCVHITQPDTKTVPNCDVSFANGKLHQAYGHVTLRMSAWPKYGHRSLVGCRLPPRLPRLYSYNWPPWLSSPSQG